MKVMTAISRVTLTVGVVSLALVGCGSNNTPASTSSSSSSSSSSSTASSSKAAGKIQPMPSQGAPGPNQTIATYIQQSGIVETIVHKGDAGQPTISGPMPDGWDDAGSDTPDWAYSAIVYTGPEAAQAGYKPNIEASLSKLTGNVDQQKLLAFAPGELNNLNGYKPLDPGEPSTLGGFPAYQLSGTWDDNGQTEFIAQKTVVIPSADVTFVLQLNAHGLDSQQDIVIGAMKAIDDGTKITV